MMRRTGGDVCRKISPPELARQWGLSADKVLAWIKTGELRAIDAATRRGGRPRYLIDIADIAAFEVARAAAPSTTAPRRTRRRRETGITEFF